MFTKLLASATFATIALASIAPASAMPSLGAGLSPAKAGAIEQVDFHRDHWRWHHGCDRYGYHCHWIRDWR